MNDAEHAQARWNNKTQNFNNSSIEESINPSSNRKLQRFSE
jgi:hypothetical protein